MPRSLIATTLLIVRLLGNVGLTQGLLSSSSFLLKTSETFKLADLQYTEARLQASLYNYTVSRLLLDRSTGSSLLLLDQLPFDVSHDVRKTTTTTTTASQEPAIPSSLRRSDWIMQILGSAETCDELLDMLRGMNNKEMMKIDPGWVLDYVRLENAESTSGMGGSITKRDDIYTMRTLLCCVSQALPTIPALNPQQRNSTLLLVDTKTVSGKNMLFFGRLCHGPSPPESSTTIAWDPILASRWVQRPFQYSSAINRKTAEIILDWLCDVMAMPRHRNEEVNDSPPLLLDPTCGSGTFLALALERGFQVVGYDINPHCVQGTRQNLVHVLGEERIQGLAHIECVDSSSTMNHSKVSEPTRYLDSGKVKKPSCVVANLPWGVNTATYVDQNVRILHSIHNTLSPGTPCVFVTKHSEPMLFQESGFHKIAQAQIPPVGFKLPKTTKKEHVDDIDTRNGRNSCVITFASSK